MQTPLSNVIVIRNLVHGSSTEPKKYHGKVRPGRFTTLMSNEGTTGREEWKER